MSEATRAAKILSRISGVYEKAREFVAAATKAWLWGSAVLSFGTGLVARSWTDATELQRGVLWGIAFTLLALLVGFWLIGLWRYLFQPLPEPPVSRKAIEPWRELHEWWEPVFAQGIDALQSVCSNARAEEVPLCLFARTHAVRPFQGESGDLARLVLAPAETVFKADLLEIERRFGHVLLDKYSNLLAWLDAVGVAALGRDGLDNHPPYVAWRSSHNKAVDAMVRNTPDIGIAAKWIATLQVFALPSPHPKMNDDAAIKRPSPPPEDPPGPKAS